MSEVPQRDALFDDLDFDSGPLSSHHNDLEQEHIFKFKSSESEDDEDDELQGGTNYVIDHEDELFLGEDTPLEASNQKKDLPFDFLNLEIQEEAQTPAPIINNFIQNSPEKS